MSKTEVYRPAKSVPIEGFTHSEIQGVRVPIDGYPFRDGHVPQFSVVAVNPHSRNGHEPVLRRISNHHGRSFEYNFGTESNILWADEKGNIFTAVNSKGNNCEAVEVCKQDITPSGFAYYGLQDSDSMVRVLKGSEMLRANGVETEVVIKVIEPAYLPYKGKLLTIPKYKKALVKAVWKTDANDDDESKNMPSLKLATRADIPAVSAALEKTLFLITVRGVQVNERLADFAATSNLEERKVMLKKAFRYVNLTERQAALKDPAYTPQFFCIDNPQDIESYFREYLPQRIARNLARVHKLDLVHFFPHATNISLVGSLYDLDSLRGEPLGLGDKEVSFEDIKQDLGRCIEGIRLLAFYPEIQPTDSNLVSQRSAVIRQNFAEAYIKESEWDQNEIEFFDGIAYLYSGFMDPGFDERANYYFAKIFEKLNLDEHVNSSALLDFIDQQIDSWDPEVRGIVGYQELQEMLQRALEALVAEKIRSQYHSHYNEALYEPSGAIFSQIFASKEAARVIGKIRSVIGEKYPPRDQTKEIPSELSSAFKSCVFDLYKKLVQNWGWEEDIIAHSNEIDRLFYEFSLAGTSTRPFMAYYRGLVVKQLGWDFVFDRSIDQMIADFHGADQEYARSAIEYLLSGGKETDREIAVEAALLGVNITGTQFIKPHHVDRYSEFAVEEIRQQLSEQHGPDILQIGEKYGDGVEQVIELWLAKKYDNMFVDDLSDQAREDIVRTAEERLNVLRKEFMTVS